MHSSAYFLGGLFVQGYGGDKPTRLLEIGSKIYQDSLRKFQPNNMEWVGMDIEDGDGVDVLIDDVYNWPFEDNSFDMIITTSCFEHDDFFWVTFLEAARVLKKGGALYINAPSSGFVHRCPQDNWRFYPDAGLALQKWAAKNGVKMTLVESFLAQFRMWDDFVAIFIKGDVPENHNIFLSDNETLANNFTELRRFGELSDGNATIRANFFRLPTYAQVIETADMFIGDDNMRNAIQLMRLWIEKSASENSREGNFVNIIMVYSKIAKMYATLGETDSQRQAMDVVAEAKQGLLKFLASV